METKDILESLINKLTDTTNDKWIKPYKNSFPQNYATKNNYSGINLLQLWFEAEEKGYKSNNWLTYKQVKELNGYVRAGEKATHVFFFKSYEIQEEETEEIKTIKFLKTFQVFNIDQTSLILEESKNETNENIEDFIKSINIKIKQTTKPFYSPSEDYIGIPSIKNFKSSDSYYSTLFHELAHSTGHKSRLNRNQQGIFGDDNYAIEELIAETTNVFLQTRFNIKSQEKNSVSYLKSWLKNQNPKVLWKIFSEAQKAFNYLP